MLNKQDRWNSHFIDLCLAHARMSKDPNTRVGAIIVGPDNEIRSFGFNGFPRGIKDSPERLSDRDLKLKLIVHAEMNAILAAARVGIPVKGCRLYLAATDDSGDVWGGPPCVRCTVEIIQSGINQIFSPPQKQHSKWLQDLSLASSLLVESRIDFNEVGYPLVNSAA